MNGPINKAELKQKQGSYWLESTTNPGYPELTEDVETDVVIVGAGIAGLAAAYLLKQAGMNVIVLEKDSVGDGVSGHTTGKVTSQHNLIYGKLAERIGIDAARLYGQANQQAIGAIADIIERERIECDWQVADNYVYTAEASKVQQFKDEAATAASLGLPATFETSADLPFDTKALVRFTGQATFHVRKYLLGLAAAINGEGSRVYEHSYVTGIRDGEPGRVKTTKAKVMAKHIIVATNVPTFPLLARGSYCVAEYPMQSYIIAGRIDHEVKGMYISPDSDHYSILPVQTDDENLLLIGGEGNVYLTRFNHTERYARLAEYARKHFGVTDIVNCWNHRDYLGYDDMPLIGKLYPWSKHTYTATGFMKWGMTNGTVAGMLLRDQICGEKNELTELFNPHRFKAPASIPKVIGEKLGIK